MVRIFSSATAPINHNGSLPANTLTLSEAFAVLERKCRDPIGFVDMIKSCKIVEEQLDTNGNLIEAHRVVQIHGIDKELLEVATLSKPFAISFRTESIDCTIQNILSPGVDSTVNPDELYLTFTINCGHPEIEEGSDEHVRLVHQYRTLAESTITNTIRAMKKSKGENSK